MNAEVEIKMAVSDSKTVLAEVTEGDSRRGNYQHLAAGT